MTITAQRHLTLVAPPRPGTPMPRCPDWCTIEHEPNEDGDEFLHSTASQEITCSRADRLDTRYGALPGYVGVELMEGPFFGAGPVIVVRHGWEAAFPCMTPGEAEAFADCLKHLAALARRDDETHEPTVAELDGPNYAAILDDGLKASL